MKLRLASRRRRRRSARRRRRRRSAFAHAHLSPPVALAKSGQLFTLAVPTEKEDATTVKVVLTVPGRLLDRLVRPRRRLEARGPVDRLGREHRDPAGDLDAAAATCRPRRTRSSSSWPRPTTAKTYTFQVEQTYSDDSVVDWNGAESSDTPAPTVEAVSSLGGGGGGSSSTLAIVALVVGAIGVVLGAIALFRGSGRELA